MVHADAEYPTQEGGEDEQQDEEARGLIVKDQTEGEEVAVAEHAACGVEAAVGVASLSGDNESEEEIDDEEEHPEVNLREKQWMIVVEGEKRCEVC
jgi:hypothetical protein